MAWFGAIYLAISASSQFLYLSSYKYIYQYDLSVSDILSTKDTVAIYDGYLEEIAPTIHLPTHFYLMQLAPDEKIYINLPAALKSLHVINDPNEQGVACNVAQHSVRLPTYNTFSLPNFPNYRLGPEEGVVCDSMITSTTTSDLTPFAFDLYPNPTNGILHLKFNELIESDDAHFNFYDVTGRLLFSRKLEKGQSNFSFDLNNLNKGIYFFKCNFDGEEVFNSKVILAE